MKHCYFSTVFAVCQILTLSQSELAVDLWNKPWGKQQNTVIYLGNKSTEDGMPDSLLISAGVKQA